MRYLKCDLYWFMWRWIVGNVMTLFNVNDYNYRYPVLPCRSLQISTTNIYRDPHITTYFRASDLLACRVIVACLLVITLTCVCHWLANMTCLKTWEFIISSCHATLLIPTYLHNTQRCYSKTDYFDLALCWMILAANYNETIAWHACLSKCIILADTHFTI